MNELSLKVSEETIGRLSRLPRPELSSWPDYSPFEPTEKTVSDLIALVRLDMEHRLEGESYHWLPVHAWRILSQHRVEKALPCLIESLLYSDEEDDWSKEELPEAIAKFGPSAIPALEKALLEETIFPEEVWGFVGLCEALGKIGEQYPEEKKTVSAVLRRKLSDCRLNQPLLNAFLVSELVDLEDVESLPVIEDTFRKDFVDENVIDWPDVREKFEALVPLPENLPREAYPSTGFQYHGDERFQRLLKTVGSHWNVNELKLFLLGSVLAIAPVPPARVLREVLVDIEGDEVGLETLGQASYFTGELFALSNEMSSYRDRLFELPGSEEDFPDGEGSEGVKWSVYAFRLRMQLLAFLEGLALGETEPRSFENAMASQFLTYLDDKVRELGEVIKAEDGERVNQGRALLSQVREFWNAHYLGFAEACRNERARYLEKREFLEAHGKVGRNEPCPCGSGRKFKKCCLPRYD